MARKKISTTVYITPEQNERLKLLHDKTKVPVAPVAPANGGAQAGSGGS